MSKKETQNTEQKPEKVMTKYDLKVQRRKEEKERERRQQRVGNIIGIVVVAALVCIVASFPIRSYLTVHETYVKVNGENISKVEFDYNYHVASNNYLTQYGYYLYMMGMDLSGDITSQMYTENLTWGDFFEELAVENLAQNKALTAQAKAEGFSYDTADDYEAYMDSLKEAASEAGRTVKSYIKDLFGSYATESRLKPYVEEMLYANAYYNELAERMKPAQGEIEAHYRENTQNYDSVDYYLKTVDAELPTEPTELADPVEEKTDTGTEGSEAGAEGSDAQGETEEAYQPSEAEIEAAMKLAKTEADRTVKSIEKDGELKTNVRRTAVATLLRDWMFDSARKQGDTTVIEDATNHRYYVVQFEDRYLEEIPSADIRLIQTRGDNGQAILDEWKGGAATEESFAALCDKYNDPELNAPEGGLHEAVSPSDLGGELGDWISDASRSTGDTTVISLEDNEYTYIVYYIAQNDAEWILDIRQTLLNETMSDYMSGLVESAQVEDPKGHLRYLEVRRAEEAAAESAAQESGEGSSEGAEESSAAE